MLLFIANFNGYVKTRVQERRWMEIRLSELIILQMSDKILYWFSLLIELCHCDVTDVTGVFFVDGDQDKEDLRGRTVCCHNSWRR